MGDLYKCKSCGQLLYGVSEPMELDGCQAEEILKTIEKNGFYTAPEPVPFLESDFAEFLVISDDEAYGTRYVAGPTFSYVLENMQADEVKIGTKSVIDGVESMICPICGSTTMYHTLGLLPTTEENGVWDNYIESDHTWYILSDSSFGEGSITELEKRDISKYIANENRDDAAVPFEEIIREFQVPVARDDTSYVKPDDIDLISFFNILTTAKVGVWLLENRLFDLVMNQMEIDRGFTRVISLTGNDLARQIAQRRAKLEPMIAETESRMAFQILPDWEEKYACRKPVPPDLTVPPEPVEPEYKKAGLLNKEKIAKENEMLRLEYLEKKNQYEQAVQAAREAEARFRQEMEDYEARRNEIFKREEIIWRGTYFYRENQNQRIALQKEMDEVINAENHFSAIVGRLTADHPINQLEDLNKEEAARNIKLLKKAYVLEAQLQTLVFVLPKYLDVIAVAKIYEYLKSGRCTQLNGSNGAYRVYDTEMRNNHFSQDSTDARAIQMDFQREYTIFSLMSDVSSAYSDLALKTDQLIYDTIHNGEMNEVDSYRESVEAYYSLAEEKLKTSEEFLREHKKQ